MVKYANLMQCPMALCANVPHGPMAPWPYSPVVWQVLLDAQQKLRVLDPFAGKEVETMDLTKAPPPCLALS